MTPIGNDGVSYEIDDSDDEATNAFLERFKSTTDKSKDAKQPSDDSSADDDDELTSTNDDDDSYPDDEDSDEGLEDSEEDADESDDDDDKTTPKSKKVILEPDAEAYVKHKVDGKEIEIKVSDLTRLYGQEASLTRKSQEAAELRKQSEESVLKYATGLESMLQRAQARWEPYSKINWLALTKDPNVSQEDLAALHKEAQTVWDDVQYLQTSLDSTVQEVQKARQADLMKQGQEAWKVLSNPETGIKGWSDKMYQDLTEYAVSEGLSKDIVGQLVDPAAFKLLHKAMLYSKGQKATKQVKGVDKTPKRIIKETPEPAKQSITKGTKGTTEARERLKRTGHVDDATDAFLELMATTKD